MSVDFECCLAAWANTIPLVDTVLIVGSQASQVRPDLNPTDIDVVLLLKPSLTYRKVLNAARKLKKSLERANLLPSAVVLAPGPEWDGPSHSKKGNVLHLILHTTDAFNAYLRFPDRGLLGWSLEHRLIKGSSPFPSGPLDPAFVEHIYGEAGLRHLRSTLLDLLFAESLCPLSGSARMLRRWARSILQIPFPVQLRAPHRNALERLCATLSTKQTRPTPDDLLAGIRTLWFICEDLQSRLVPMKSTRLVRGDSSP